METRPTRRGRNQMASRTHKAKLNIATSLLSQIVSMICGLVVPQLMIRTFGSELYGATTSIAQFLAYITLIEGGVAGAARAVLYKPLADGDAKGISDVYHEVSGFFRAIGLIFIFYTIALAGGYKYIANHSDLEWLFSAGLVAVIGISTLGQYFIGISNSILIQADQRNYINNCLSIVTVIINTVCIIILTRAGCGIIIIKLASSLIFVMRPVILALYVRKHYRILPAAECNRTGALSQKWTALGQHIAFFLHSNTDIVVLTIFVDLKTVAVYSVYNMVIANIRNLTASFSNGLESLFGNMYAKKETDNLNRVFGYYETLISIVSIILFSTTAVMIIPFVQIYTSGINDVNYIIPNFAIIAILAELVYTLRTPYHYMANAANRFKQTRLAAYGEAAINITLSIALVFRYRIVGVALATLIAMSFRSAYYAVYISKHILYRKIGLYIKRNLINACIFVAVFLAGNTIFSNMAISGYLTWALYGFAVLVSAAAVTLLINVVFYRRDVADILKHIKIK